MREAVLLFICDRCVPVATTYTILLHQRYIHLQRRLPGCVSEPVSSDRVRLYQCMEWYFVACLLVHNYGFATLDNNSLLVFSN